MENNNFGFHCSSLLLFIKVLTALCQVEQTLQHASKQQDQISNFPYTLPWKFKHTHVPPCTQYLL